MIPRFGLLGPHGPFRWYLSRPPATAPLDGPGTWAGGRVQLAKAGAAAGALTGADDSRPRRRFA
jgi:hypothetical protein